MATKRTTFDERRDQATAEDVSIEKHLLCRAKGCPNRWTVDVGHVCSAHYHAPTHSWPQITQEQLDAETDRALAQAAGRVQVEPLSRDQKTEILQKLLGISKQPQSRAWARTLKDRELRGERLNAAQRTMWRDALGEQLAMRQGEIEA